MAYATQQLPKNRSLEVSQKPSGSDELEVVLKEIEALRKTLDPANFLGQPQQPVSVQTATAVFAIYIGSLNWEAKNKSETGVNLTWEPQRMDWSLWGAQGVAPSVFDKARNHIVHDAQNTRQARQALDFIDQLADSCRRLGKTDLPPIMTSFAENGSLVLEWQERRKRLGVSFEQALEDSFWYFIDLDSKDAIESHDSLSDLDVPKVLSSLLE